MTFGYPDYQRVSHRSGSQLTYGTNLAIPGNVIPGVTSGRLDVDQFDELTIYVDTTGLTEFYLVQVYWYPIFNATAQYKVDTWTCGPGAQHTIDVPVNGPQCYVSISLQNQTAETGLTFYVYGKTNTLRSIPTASNGVAGIVQRVSVAASSNFVQEFDQVGNFRATLHIGNEVNAVWDAWVNLYDIGIPGWSRYMIFNVDKSKSDMTIDMALPRTPIQITMRNLDTSAHVMEMALIVYRA